MTLPKDVQEAIDAGDAALGNYSAGFTGHRHWQTIRVHLMSQEAEIERQKSITNIICDAVSAALLRAGFHDVDDPGEAIDIIRERAELAESRLAAADALLRDCIAYIDMRVE